MVGYGMGGSVEGACGGLVGWILKGVKGLM